ncbi:MAG: zinc ABC transporter substrate-binding protein, partial [Clostridia bacterium]|nr:zinc ABC transporter substrate-binding protein [Clostridia bacterium]
IYLGVGFEPWVDRVLPDLGARVKLEAARGVLDHRTLDPHVWLDPVRAQQMVDSIAEAYTAADPARASEYRSRAAAYRERLADLDTRYRDGLARCATRTVMTTHEAFGYLANRYGLELVPIMGLSPEAEPGPRRLAELRRVARERGVRAVFTEPLVSPRVAEALAAEIGAETLMLNPVEGLTKEEAAAGADYLAIMLENLRQLQRGLGCQP